MSNDLASWARVMRPLSLVNGVNVEVNDSASLDAFRAAMFPYCTDQTAAEVYLDSLVKHIRYVREAGRRLGVTPLQLEWHDQSKFSLAEFPAAVEKYHMGDPNPNRYAAAWLNHIHLNPHHWQHYMFPDGFTPKGSSVEAGVMEMPFAYVLEMVADWMGSSMTYTGSWDMTEWLTKNMGRIRLHSHTAREVRDLLAALDYPHAVIDLRWASRWRGRKSPLRAGG